MKLQLDPDRTYAIALEGGGALGAYEVGVWKALDEAGIRYNAVSGTSVGALNGALMAMRDLDRALDAWRNIKVSDVIRVEPENEEVLKNALKGRVELKTFHQLARAAGEIIGAGGLDVEPLRCWVRRIIDPEKILNSDVTLFVPTVNLTDLKAMMIRINDLKAEEVCDMLLASAYHPTFRREKLGGKNYTDGGFVDALPLGILAEQGYKDIIAVRLPSLGVEKLFIKPADVTVTTIEARSELGSTLNFDGEQARRCLDIGYLDARRVLYGLTGTKYYIERTMTEKEALDAVLDLDADENDLQNLRRYLEVELPLKSLRYSGKGGGYYGLLTALLENEAEKIGLEELKEYTDCELLALVRKNRERSMP